MSKVYNNSKSALVLQKYTTEEIQKLLNSGKFKSEIVRQLKINIRAFNIYIKEPVLYLMDENRKFHISNDKLDSYLIEKEMKI